MGKLHEKVLAKLSALNRRHVAQACLILALNVVILSSNTLGYTRRMSNDSDHANTVNNSHYHDNDLYTSSDSQNFVIWTYPIHPPVDHNLRNDETLICSFSQCPSIEQSSSLQNVDLDFMHDNQHININLKDVSSDNPVFADYVKNHAWYKIQQGTMFPHHIQAIALLSVARHKKACVRTLGQDVSTSICYKDLKKFEGYDPRKETEIPSNLQTMIPIVDFTQKHFSIMDFQKREEMTRSQNVEDEMQSIVGAQFMPYISGFVDREEGLPSMVPNEHLFANGWWGGRMAFPPPAIDDSNISFFSLHISGAVQGIVAENHAYFREYNEKVGAVGARDLPTLDFLMEQGIGSYLSSDFTAMINMGDSDKNCAGGLRCKGRTNIFIIDVDPDKLPDFQAPSNVLSTVVHIESNTARESRFEPAYDLLTQISQEAKVVITGRIHSAMAAMAQNIPVIFVENALEGENERMQQTGIINLFHRWDPSKGEEWKFDLDNMPPNPGVHLFDRYRASFLNNMKTQSSVHLNTAKLYGMIPLQRLGQNVPMIHLPENHNHEPVHDRFHFIFTTDPETITWRVTRAVESVFFHHPDAKVSVHSNTLPLQGSKFDIFAEAGYDCRIERYDIEKLMKSHTDILGEEVVTTFLNVLEDRRKEQYWYSHETDLLRMMIMVSEGGVYLDTDQYVLHPIPKSMNNVLAWQDKQHQLVNGAAMIFDHHNPYLEKTFIEATRRVSFSYNPDNWGIIGPNLLTAMYKANDDKSKTVTVLNNDVFYPYVFYEAKNCFEKQESEFNPITPRTFTVHLNTKMTQQYSRTKPGTVCDNLFRNYCIFCDEVFTTPV